VSRKRRPWVAAVGTLLQPGLGHLYAGAPRRGFAAVLIALLAPPLWGSCLVLLADSPGSAIVTTVLFLCTTMVLAVDAALAARRQPVGYILRPYNRWYIYLVAVITIGTLGMVATELTRKHFVQAFRIPTASMEPSVQLGDFIFVSMWRPTADLRHGSIVVFRSVEEPDLKVLKRVVGLPGDTLTMRDGILNRNGATVPEPYAVHEDPTRKENGFQRAKMRGWQISHLVAADTFISSYEPDLQDWGAVVVPPLSIMVLGDNRDHSYDSRYYGFIPFGYVVGRPTFVYYSHNPSSPKPWRVVSAPRWDRVGMKLSD
jgi:signal peptidase I